MARFNRIAYFYDFLKHLIFKKDLDKAASHFIKEIPSTAKILLIGGGSGKLLALLGAKHQVTYLDASEKMIALAKKREYHAQVTFITADVMNFQANQNYDVVITPFFLDCFNEKSLGKVFQHINHQLTTDGLWLHSDFYPQNQRQQLLIRLMYLCFWLSTGLKVSKIPDFDKYFVSDNFFEEKKVVFRNAMVHSYIYKKIAS